MFLSLNSGFQTIMYSGRIMTAQKATQLYKDLPLSGVMPIDLDAPSKGKSLL